MSLGVRNVEDEDIDKMMAEAPGALNFTTFLNMLAEKLHGTDPEDVMIEGNFIFNSNTGITHEKIRLFQICSTFQILMNLDALKFSSKNIQSVALHFFLLSYKRQ